MRRFFTNIAAVLVVLLLPAVVNAQETVLYSPLDLAELSVGPVPGVAGGPVELSFERLVDGQPTGELLGECSLVVSGDVLLADAASSCPILFSNRSLADFRVLIQRGEEAVELNLVMDEFVAAGMADYIMADGVVHSMIPAGMVIYSPVGEEWLSLPLTDSGYAVPAELQGLVVDQEIKYGWSPNPSGGGVVRFRLLPLASADPDPNPDSDPDPDSGGDPDLGAEPGPDPVPDGAIDNSVRKRIPDFDCPDPHGTDDYYTLCVVAGEADIEFKLFPRLDHVVRPNHSLNVVVSHWSVHEVIIEASGTPGLQEARNRTRSGGPALGATLGDRIVSRKSFAPRPPGPVIITVTLLDELGEVIAQDTVELVVEETYSGVFRIGIAGVFFGAVDGDYKARRAQGSAQAELIAASDAPVDIEFVVSFSPYLDAGGRGVTGCESAPWCFSPYVAIGALAPSNGEVEFFKSLHLGAEWEPLSNFSIAVTGVARRVDRLDDDARIGGPVESGGLPVSETLGIGMGIVINVSPDFFKVAAQPATQYPY